MLGKWHPMANGSLTPDNVPPGSYRRIWWRCELGHPYRATVRDRVERGYGCPYCVGKPVLAGFNDLATQEPELAEQWYTPMNKEYKAGYGDAGQRDPRLVGLRQWTYLESAGAGPGDGEEWLSLLRKRAPPASGGGSRNGSGRPERPRRTRADGPAREDRTHDREPMGFGR